MLGWLFLHEDDTAPVDGEFERFDGPLCLGTCGLRWHAYPTDALRIGHGTTVCRVEAGGQILRLEWDTCSSERTILWRADAAEAVRDWQEWRTRQPRARTQDALIARAQAARHELERALLALEPALATAVGYE